MEAIAVKTCKACNKPVEGKKTFCNDACRKAFSRKSDKQPGQSEPGQPKSDTVFRDELGCESKDSYPSLAKVRDKDRIRPGTIPLPGTGSATPTVQ